MLASIISAINLSLPEKKTLLNPGLLKRSLALQTGTLADLAIQPMADFFAELSVGLFPGKVYISGDRLFWLMFDLLKSSDEMLTYFGESAQFEGPCPAGEG